MEHQSGMDGHRLRDEVKTSRRVEGSQRSLHDRVFGKVSPAHLNWTASPLPRSEAFLPLRHPESDTAVHVGCLSTMKPLSNCHQPFSIFQRSPTFSKSSSIDCQKASLTGETFAVPCYISKNDGWPDSLFMLIGLKHMKCQIRLR